MLARETPCRFAVTCHIQHWKQFAHGIFLHQPGRNRNRSNLAADFGVAFGTTTPLSFPSGSFSATLQFVVTTCVAACTSFQHSLAIAQSSSARITKTRTRESAVEISLSREGHAFVLL